MNSSTQFSHEFPGCPSGQEQTSIHSSIWLHSNSCRASDFLLASLGDHGSIIRKQSRSLPGLSLQAHTLVGCLLHQRVANMSIEHDNCQ